MLLPGDHRAAIFSRKECFFSNRHGDTYLNTHLHKYGNLQPNPDFHFHGYPDLNALFHSLADHQCHTHLHTDPDLYAIAHFQCNRNNDLHAVSDFYAYALIDLYTDFHCHRNTYLHTYSLILFFSSRSHE
jgi:hypothetical protein